MAAPTSAAVRYVVIETEHDEVVTQYTNAFLSGSNVTNITVQSQCPGDPVAHIGRFDAAAFAGERAEPAQLESQPVVQSNLQQLRAGHLTGEQPTVRHLAGGPGANRGPGPPQAG